MFATYNYFRQYCDLTDIEDPKKLFTQFSNTREFGGEFTNYDHLVKNRFMNVFGHMFNTVLRKRPGKILDVGCGNGVNLPLANVFPDVEYNGLDLAENTLVNARRQYPNIKFHVGDAFQMPFPDRTFDLTILSSVLILYKAESDRLNLLREVSRVTSDKGIVALIVWNDSPLLNASIKLSRVIGKLLRQNLPLDFNGYHFTRGEIEHMARLTNLKVEEAIHTSHLYGILESVRYLNMSKYNRTFGKAESEAREQPQNILRDLQRQAGALPWLTALFFRLGNVVPNWFSFFTIYVLSNK